MIKAIKVSSFSELKAALNFDLADISTDGKENGNIHYCEKQMADGRKLFYLVNLAKEEQNVTFKIKGEYKLYNYDVVSGEGEWKYPAFCGEIHDDALWGRGAVDTKTPLFAEFSALEEILNEGFEPPCDIYLATAVDEEISGNGAPTLVNYLKSKGVHLDVAMDEGGAILKGQLPTMDGWCAAIGILEKGYIDLKVIAKGKGGHSSTPKSNTPLARLSKFVADIEKDKPFKAEISAPVYAMLDQAAPLLGFPLRMVLGNMWLFKGLLTKVLPMISPMCNAFTKTTFCCTMAEGSQTPNVIPSEAYVVCNLRTSPHQNVEQSLAVLKKYADKYDLEFEIIHARNASNTVDYKGEEFSFLKKCLNAIEENISNQDFGVEELSAAVGVSKAQLYRKISSITGQSSVQFIRSIRLKRAAQLLLQDDSSVSDIMYMVGFNSQSYFSKIFKEEFGCMPREYTGSKNKSVAK